MYVRLYIEPILIAAEKMEKGLEMSVEEKCEVLLKTLLISALPDTTNESEREARVLKRVMECDHLQYLGFHSD